MTGPETTRALFVHLYEDLRRLALAYMGRERPSHTLSATALVHEAYLRLSQQKKQEWEDRRHFYGVAATMMRRILVNHAQHLQTAKRGHEWQRVHLDRVGAGESDAFPPVGFLALEEALDDLQALDRRQAEIVDLRFFLGLTTGEIASLLGVSPRTVAAEWAMARAWLFGRLSESA